MSAEAPDERLAHQRLAADALIRKYVLASMGVGLVPVPLVDLVAVTAMEVKLITDMATIYEFPVPHRLVALKLLVSVVGSAGSVYVAAKMGTLVKTSPGVGHALHASLFALSGGVAVYAVGKLFQKHYESGGRFLGGGRAVVRRAFEDARTEGRAVVPQWVSP